MPISISELEDLLKENKFKDVLDAITEIPEAERTWQYNFLLARAYNNLDDFSEERLQFAVDCLKGLDSSEIIPQIAFITEILTIYYRTSRNFEGLNYVNHGFALIEKLEVNDLPQKDQIFVSDLLNNIAIIYSNTNQQKLAIDALEQRINILERFDLPDHQSITYSNLGYAYHSMGKIKHSLNVQLKALGLARDSENLRNIAINLNNIGGNYALLGDLELAERTLVESISISQEIGMQHLTCYSYSVLSQVYQKRGDSETAMSYLDTAYEMQEQFDDVSLQMMILFHKTMNYLEMGELEEAKKIRDELVEIIKNEPPESRLLEYPIILEALILKESKLYKNKIQAESILREFLKNEKPKNSRLQLQAFLALSDILLEQLQLDERGEDEEFEDQELEIIAELQGILDVINEKAVLEESIDLQIQAQILRAYLKLAEFKPEEAMDAFEQASFYSSVSGIEAIAIHTPNLEKQDEATIKGNFSSFNPEIVRSLDNIIHSIPRLEIILLLTQNGRLTYTELREYTGLTPGNLGRHCNKLVEVGYIFKDKEIVDDKFLTVYEMTPEGLNQFNRYSQILSPILKPDQ